MRHGTTHLRLGRPSATLDEASVLITTVRGSYWHYLAIIYPLRQVYGHPHHPSIEWGGTDWEITGRLLETSNDQALLCNRQRPVY